jgi:hypothetical protein
MCLYRPNFMTSWNHNALWSERVGVIQSLEMLEGYVMDRGCTVDQ